MPRGASPNSTSPRCPSLRRMDDCWARLPRMPRCGRSRRSSEWAICHASSPDVSARSLRSGVRLNIRGRTIRVRAIQAPGTGIIGFLAILGPGLIAATAGDDAGGIATYSQVGAKYGYELLWVLLIITLSLAVVQEMCARLGAATGRGLLDLIRERYGIGWALFAVSVVLLANAGLLVTEFVGIGAAADLLGLSRWLVVPVAALLLRYL